MQALCKALGARHSWQQQQERRRRSRAAGGGARAGGGAPRPLPPSTEKAKKVCVVGGGWAGFGAAKHLSEQQGYEVTLLDAAPNPGGLSAGWRTPQGRAVEAGVKGFWFQYHNIFKMVRELGIPWPFTDFDTSGFWGRDGLITSAPVFSKQPRLPAVLGQFFYTARLFFNLPLADRATVLPWLYSAIDLGSTPGSYERYDSMTALESFRRFGVTQRAYEEFLKPTLLVGLFAPPEELSAAVTIETLYFYALAHQSDFDVCWCRGSVSELIFQPLLEHIKNSGGIIQGGRLVRGIETDSEGNVTALVSQDAATGSEERHECDAVVFAISIAGMQRLVQANPALAERQEFSGIMNLKSIDCIATRLWFDRRVPTRFPANVLAGFEQDCGATFFDLTYLQAIGADEYKNVEGSVIAADFYGASRLLPLSDADILKKVCANIAACEPGFKDAKLVDAAVLRFPRAVTHFSPGSAKWRPYQTTSFSNLFMAGDWVKGLDHGANGLSQERAWITGLTAANLVIKKLGRGQPAEILPVEPDEPHIALAKELNKSAKSALLNLGIRSPFL